MGAGREFQFLEVMGTNVLAKEVVRHFSNLTAKECWESAKRVLRARHTLWEELLTLTHQRAPAVIVSIVKGKGRDISSVRAESSINLMARF